MDSLSERHRQTHSQSRETGTEADRHADTWFRPDVEVCMVWHCSLKTSALMVLLQDARKLLMHSLPASCKICSNAQHYRRHGTKHSKSHELQASEHNKRVCPYCLRSNTCCIVLLLAGKYRRFTFGRAVAGESPLRGHLQKSHLCEGR